MKLNNKGYMIIEIIMASMITFGIAYFLFDLTVNLKNKSDDIQKKTVVMKDRAIIENYIMKALNNGTGIGCETDKILSYKNNDDQDHKIGVADDYIYDKVGDEYQYKKKSNDYISFLGFSCNDNETKINITIEIKDKLTDERYNIKLTYIN